MKKAIHKKLSVQDDMKPEDDFSRMKDLVSTIDIQGHALPLPLKNDYAERLLQK